MAPIEPSGTAEVEAAIRETIQSLYNILLHTSNYNTNAGSLSAPGAAATPPAGGGGGAAAAAQARQATASPAPTTAAATAGYTSLDALIDEVHLLAASLQAVAKASTPPPFSESQGSGPGALSAAALPRDLVQYVEAGRNPDIYTREFVELVRRTNQLRAGKHAAFASFRGVLAEQVRAALPELAADVDRVLAATGESRGTGATGGPATATEATEATAATTAASAKGAAAVATTGTNAPPPPTTTTTTKPNGAPLSGVPPTSAAVVDMLGMLPTTPQQPGTPAATAGATGATAIAAGAGGPTSAPNTTAATPSAGAAAGTPADDSDAMQA